MQSISWVFYVLFCAILVALPILDAILFFNYATVDLCQHPQPVECGIHGSCVEGICVCVCDYTGEACEVERGVDARIPKFKTAVTAESLFTVVSIVLAGAAHIAERVFNADDISEEVCVTMSMIACVSAASVWQLFLSGHSLATVWVWVLATISMELAVMLSTIVLFFMADDEDVPYAGRWFFGAASVISSWSWWRCRSSTTSW